MPNTPIKDSANTTKLKPSKKPKRHSKKEAKATLNPLETMEKKIKQRSCKANKAFLDERTINPKTKKLLEALSTELGLSKEVIAELAITLYRFYKDKA